MSTTKTKQVSDASTVSSLPLLLGLTVDGLLAKTKNLLQPIQVPMKADFNDIVKTGFYQVYGDSANAPSCYAQGCGNIMYVAQLASTYSIQILFDVRSTKRAIYCRSLEAGEWLPWQAIIFAKIA